jgi:hypothetical protein
MSAATNAVPIRANQSPADTEPKKFAAAGQRIVPQIFVRTPNL